MIFIQFSLKIQYGKSPYSEPPLDGGRAFLNRGNGKRGTTAPLILNFGQNYLDLPLIFLVLAPTLRTI